MVVLILLKEDRATKANKFEDENKSTGKAQDWSATVYLFVKKGFFSCQYRYFSHDDSIILSRKEREVMNTVRRVKKS